MNVHKGKCHPRSLHVVVVVSYLVKKGAAWRLHVFYVISVPDDPHWVNIIKFNIKNNLFRNIFFHTNTLYAIKRKKSFFFLKLTAGFYAQKSKKLYHWKGCSMQYPCKTCAYSKEKFCKFKSLFFLPGRNWTLLFFTSISYFEENVMSFGRKAKK